MALSKATVVLMDKGMFGACSCGGDVLFYSDHGVQCRKCSKLYGVWYDRIKKKKILNRIFKTVTSTPVLGGKLSHGEEDITVD